MALFTRQHLKDLQAIVDGEYYSEIAITHAISTTDDRGTKILLQNLITGLYNFEMRMELQTFICTENAKLKQ